MIMPFRVLVTISRGWDDIGLVRQQLDHRLDTAITIGRPLLVIHGDYKPGSDEIADLWAKDMIRQKMPVAVEPHPAENHPTQDFGPWPAAGQKRNRYMVSLGADECLAFIGPCDSPRCRRPQPHPSHGATKCAQFAEEAGIPTRRWTA